MLKANRFTSDLHLIMQNKALQIIVGLLGFVLVAVLLFAAVSKESVLEGAKAAVALLVTRKLILSMGKKGSETHEITVTSKRNAKLVVIGLAVGLLLPLVLVWFITQIVR